MVYTSYDYSAPLRETRQQWDKLFQTKLVNMFSGSSSDLLRTVMVGNGTGFKVRSKQRETKKETTVGLIFKSGILFLRLLLGA